MSDKKTPPSSNPLKLIGRVSRGFGKLADGALRDHGFATGQLPVLGSLKGGTARSQAELARINEVNDFVKSKPAVSQLLMHLGETLPKDIALDAYEQQAQGVTLRGTVRGTPDQASGYASAYLDQLRTDSVLAKYFDDFGFSGQGVSRNAQTHRLSLQLFLHFKNAPKGEKR